MTVVQPIFSVLMGNPDPELIANLKGKAIPLHFANLERLLGAPPHIAVTWRG